MTDQQIEFILIAGIVFGAPLGALIAAVLGLRKHHSCRMGLEWCAFTGAVIGAGTGYFAAGWLCLAAHVVRGLSK